MIETFITFDINEHYYYYYKNSICVDDKRPTVTSARFNINNSLKRGWRLGARSWAPALVHHHLGQVPFDDVGVGAEVDQGHAGELEGCTARPEAGQPVQPPVLVQHVRVVREEGVRGAVGSTFSPAIVGVVASGM